MKKVISTTILCFVASSIMLASDYEQGMLKGKEMFNNAKTAEEAVNVTNYFERIAEANKEEWLPLYYAAYASLSVGHQQEKSKMKDEWYEKGLVFIERAKKIKNGESELIAMEGYLKLMYIANSPMMRAPMQTGDAMELLEQAKKLNPDNPRPWLIQGQHILYTPQFFGGGADSARPMLEKANSLYKNFSPSNRLMPVWGLDRCEKLLVKCTTADKE